MKNVIGYRVFILLIIFSAMVMGSLTASAQTIGTPRQTQTDQNDVKGKVGSLSGTSMESAMLTLGNVWSVKECCGWSGLWIRRQNTNTFDARWRHTNGSTATDVLQLSNWDRTTNVVTITRKSMNGYYKATYNPAAKTLVNGTATWYTSGNTWSATLE